MKDPSVYNVIKAPVGWVLYLDGVRVGGVYATKEATLEAAAVAASFAVREGDSIQINVPGEDDEVGKDKSWPTSWNAFLK
jgi:hypothetical protein